MEERLINLENLVYSLIKRVDNEKFYNNADKAGMQHTTSETATNQQAQISDNSDAIFDLANIVAELEENANG